MPDPNDFNTIQSAFSSGELAPSMWGRVDVAKYANGAARIRNMFIDVRGGASTRPGTQFIGAVANSAYPVKLIPFSFSTFQTYILEFGQNTMRVITNGAYVTSGGSTYVLSTPWAAADLWRLRYAQSADVMTITHPDYVPYDLTRTGDAAWTLTAVDFGVSFAAPAGLTVGSKVGGGTTIYRYVVTAVVGAQESLASAPVGSTVSSVMSVNGNEYQTVSWLPVAGASSYNVYRQEEVPNGAPDVGALYGLVGTVQGLAFQDRNASPDFAQTLPVLANPFKGGAITAVTPSGGSGYSNNVAVTATDATGEGFQGFAVVTGGVPTSVVIQQGGWGYTAPTIVFTDRSGSGSGASGTSDVQPPAEPTSVAAPDHGANAGEQSGNGQGGGTDGGGGNYAGDGGNGGTNGGSDGPSGGAGVG